MNLTTSFKDRGMAVALSRALSSGDRACVCASTGYTAAAASAYSAWAGISCFVVVLVGKSVLAIRFRLSDLSEASLLASDASRDLVTATD